MKIVSGSKASNLSLPRIYVSIALFSLLVACGDSDPNPSGASGSSGAAEPELAEGSKPLGMGARLSDSDWDLASDVVYEFLNEEDLSENDRISKSTFEAPTLIGAALMLKDDYKDNNDSGTWDFSDLEGDEKRETMLSIAKVLVGSIRIENADVAYEMSHALLVINEQLSEEEPDVASIAVELESSEEEPDATSVAEELRSLLEPILEGRIPFSSSERAFGRKLSTILAGVLEPVGGLNQVFIWDPKDKHFNTPD